MNSVLSIAEDTPEAALFVEAELLKSLAESNEQSINRSLIFTAKNAAGDVVGGISGSTSYGWLLIKTLWVAEPQRGSGMGIALVNRIEGAAIELGCHAAWLDTSNSDSCRFYANRGYQVFGELTNTERHFPNGHCRWFMKKVLSSG